MGAYLCPHNLYIGGEFMSKKSKVKDVKIKNIEIVLDKPRTLRFDLNAFAELEDSFGTIDEALGAMEKGSIKALRAILWSGLIHEDENLTLRDVGSLITLADLPKLTEGINQAIVSAVPTVEGQEGPNV
jgi:hypothetical protein